MSPTPYGRLPGHYSFGQYTDGTLRGRVGGAMAGAKIAPKGTAVTDKFEHRLESDTD